MGEFNKDKKTRTTTMSAFMVNNRTLTIIAKYMAECANYKLFGRLGRQCSIDSIEFDKTMMALLNERGCYDAKAGMYLPQNIHRILVEENRKALCERYTEGEKMGGGSEYDWMEEGVGIDTKECTRKEWLVNLYEVTRCYHYQIAEGDFRANPFYVEMEKWIAQMAAELAAYVVEEFRPRYPKAGEPYKCWEEF